ncbi:M-phase inducer phosphatase 2-like [Dromiciops gliroides]|uniref:M-phase inducer phosphatase 2-like n=1 Tax=Dromiciops gliroides TaxID=33562 RepID=UPI001CC3BE53|nr:M-phase inducer phosphatase 2-like [Dromiciops gliroides]
MEQQPPLRNAYTESDCNPRHLESPVAWWPAHQNMGQLGLFVSPDSMASGFPGTTLTQVMSYLTGPGRHQREKKQNQALQSTVISRSWESLSLDVSEALEFPDAGLLMDPPSPMDCGAMDHVFQEAIPESGKIQEVRFPNRCFQSLPIGSSQALRNVTNTMGLDMGQKGKDDIKLNIWSREDEENVRFVFKMSSRPVGHNYSTDAERANQREAFAQRSYLAPDLMCFAPGEKEEKLSPLSLHHFSRIPASSSGGNIGPNILEEQNEIKVPPGMESPLSAPLIMTKEKESEQSLIKQRKHHQLLCSPSMPSTSIGPISKGLEWPRGKDTPVKKKPRKSMTISATTGEKEEEPKGGLFCPKSSCLDKIEKILNNDPRELIGDYSKAFLLQMITGYHQDLKYISPEVMVAVLTGKLSNIIEKYVILDCRYPYEFEGGHIKGAVNLPLKQDAEDFLLVNPILSNCVEKRIILIFYCEFSSERGPRMCRFIRDRDRNTNNYPNLYYPEMYILKGGYKDFFPQYPTLCEPQSYRPMNHEDFKEERISFRLKNRTEERSKQDMSNRLKDF